MSPSPQPTSVRYVPAGKGLHIDGGETTESNNPPQFESGQLQRVSVQHPYSRVPVYFLHIYKSGGTSFCSTARSVGKRVPPGLNCNLKRGLSKQPPNEQLRQLRKYDVSCNEYDGLPNQDSLLVSPGAVSYVVILRDPLNRFMSHFAAAQVFSRGNQGAFRNLGRLRIPGSAESVSQRRKERVCLFHECSFAEFLHWLEGRRTNPTLAPSSLNLPWARGDFVLRYFVGFDACDFGACTERHLNLAMARLESLFKVVLILEDLARFDVASSHLGWGAMEAVLGWPSAEAVRRAGTHRSSDARSELEGDPSALASLKLATGDRDLKLYEFARALVRTRGAAGPKS